MTSGSFLIGIGNLLCLYGSAKTSESSESLFEFVARRNGPLEDYNPQMLLQCLLWGKKHAFSRLTELLSNFIGKVELVKEIIVNLARSVQSYESSGTWHWISLPAWRFYETGHGNTAVFFSLYKPLFLSNWTSMAFHPGRNMVHCLMVLMNLTSATVGYWLHRNLTLM